MEQILVKIYALINPFDDTIFYIGATTKDINKRVYQHVQDMKSGRHIKIITPKNQLLAKIYDAGLYPEIIELDLVPLAESTFFEDFYISLFKSYGFNVLQVQKSRFEQIYSKRLVSQSEKWRIKQVS